MPNLSGFTRAFQQGILPRLRPLVATFFSGGARRAPNNKYGEDPFHQEHDFTARMLDKVGSLVIVLDCEGKIVQFNRACEETTGYRFDEVNGHTISALFIEPEQADNFRQQFEKTCAGTAPKRYVNNWLTRDGHKRVIAWSNETLRDDDSNPTFLISTGTDITEQHMGEEQLLISYGNQEVLNALLHLGIEDLPLDEQMSRAIEIILTIPWLPPNPQGGIFIVEDDPQMLVLKAQQGLSSEVQKGCATVPFGHCICGLAASSGKSQFSAPSDQYDDDHIEFPGMTPHGHYNIPIKQGNHVLGVIVLYLRIGHNLDVRETEFLEVVASTLAGIIEHRLAREALRRSEANLVSAQRIAHLGSWDWNIAGKKLYCSEETRHIFGLSPSQVPDSTHEFIKHVHPDDRQTVRRVLYRSLRHLEPYEIEYRIIRSDGEERTVYQQGEVTCNGSDKPVRMLGTVMDITQRLIAEQELRLIAGVFEGTQEGIIVTDANARVLRVNQAFTTITGYSAEEIIGKNPNILSSRQHGKEFFQNMWASINETGSWQGEIWNRRKGGDIFPEWINISAVRNDRNEIIQYISIFTDIAEKKISEERIHRLAHYDVLTELPNRALFQERLSQELFHAHRRKQAIAVLFLDLDGFKRINDSMGHSAGDHLLQIMATRLRQCIRDDDTVSRWGGDEFAFVLTDLNHSEDAALVARKILDSVAEPVSLDDHEQVVVSASIGISLYPADGDNAQTLVQNADMAMYRAKDSGRNNYQFFTSEMNTAVIERLSMETGLRSALELDQFELYYQPQMDIESRHITGVEALVRWNHPKRGLISPLKFIPVAEESGLIIPIGEWVLREACKAGQQWHQNGLQGLKISVNLSARQFQDNNLVTMVNDALEKSGLEPALLTLELTESSIMDNAEETIATLLKLKEIGIGLSIDDFGTGYSSLSYLKRFPIDVLKIDRSFVRDLVTDMDDRAITQTIIAMGHALHLKIIAEGVETEEHLDFLQRRHCDQIQGYLISPPLTETAFLEFVLQWQAEIHGKCKNRISQSS